MRSFIGVRPHTPANVYIARPLDIGRLIRMPDEQDDENNDAPSNERIQEAPSSSQRRRRNSSTTNTNSNTSAESTENAESTQATTQTTGSREPLNTQCTNTVHNKRRRVSSAHGRRLAAHRDGSNYSYELPWVGVCTDDEEYYNNVLGGAGGGENDEPLPPQRAVTTTAAARTNTATTATPSVVEPETWVSFDYPRPTTHLNVLTVDSDTDLATPAIDYSAPRRPVFEATPQLAGARRNGSWRSYFRPPRSQHTSFREMEDHPFYQARTADRNGGNNIAAAALDFAVSGRSTYDTRLSVSNPDLSPQRGDGGHYANAADGQTSARRAATPDQLPGDGNSQSCASFWVAVGKFCQEMFSCGNGRQQQHGGTAVQTQVSSGDAAQAAINNNDTGNGNENGHDNRNNNSNNNNSQSIMA